MQAPIQPLRPWLSFRAPPLFQLEDARDFEGFLTLNLSSLFLTKDIFATQRVFTRKDNLACIDHTANELSEVDFVILDIRMVAIRDKRSHANPAYCSRSSS